MSLVTHLNNIKNINKMTMTQLKKLKERFYQLVNHKLGDSF